MRALTSAPIVEELLIDLERDPARAKCIGKAEWERPRHVSLLDAETTNDTDRQLVRRRARGELAPADLVRAELLGGPNLEAGAEPIDPRRLHRADDDDTASVDLGVDERIGDAERHLVPELGSPNRVADDEDSHGRRSYRRG
jgi:hypothetical protein